MRDRPFGSGPVYLRNIARQDRVQPGNLRVNLARDLTRDRFGLRYRRHVGNSHRVDYVNQSITQPGRMAQHVARRLAINIYQDAFYRGQAGYGRFCLLSKIDLAVAELLDERAELAVQAADAIDRPVERRCLVVELL